MRLRLERSWKLCIEMWTWIVKEWRRTNKRSLSLKAQWMDEHGFKDDITADCFFCEYNAQHRKEEAGCVKCPARLIDPNFDCGNEEYDYEHHPDKFLNKIRALNRKRLKAKNGVSK